MKKAISALKDYQVTLTRISALEKELSLIPPEIKKLETDWKKQSSQVEQYKEELEELKKNKRQDELDLQTEEEKHKKFESDLSEVTNDKEYNAVLREIDMAKKEMGRYKEQIKTAGESMKDLEAKIEEGTILAAESKKQFEKELSDYRKSQDKLSSELKSLKSEANIVMEGIPKGLLSKFNRIAERRNGVGLAFCQDSICKSCNVRVRHHIVEQLKMHDKALQCESCRRILYYLEPNQETKG